MTHGERRQPRSVRPIGELWSVIWPFALAAAAHNGLMAVTVFRPGHHAPGFHPQETIALMIARWLAFGSLMPAPGVALFDMLAYFFAAWRGMRRTRQIGTSILAAAATAFVGVVGLFTTAAVITPALLGVPLANPALLLIFAVYVLVPVAFAAAAGAVAVVVGKWAMPSAPKLRLS